jgi:hypothetical protein
MDKAELANQARSAIYDYIMAYAQGNEDEYGARVESLTDEVIFELEAATYKIEEA